MHSPQKLGHILHSHLLVCDRLRAAQIPASPTHPLGEAVTKLLLLPTRTFLLDMLLSADDDPIEVNET